MSERCVIRVDGAEVEARAGMSVAVALLRSGTTCFRDSVRGEPRGPICAMGVCFECRVTIDGIPHRRACMEACAPGMVVETTSPGDAHAETHPFEEIHAQVAVVGAGPAGIAAACAAAESGVSVVVVDEGQEPGGQIWRGASRAAHHPGALRWRERLARSGARVVSGATVVDALEDGRVLLVDRLGGPIRLHADRLVVATGARERFLPFPGWTLPGVIGVGAAQALMKSGLSFRGKRVVIGGSGPLLLPVAALMTKDGADLRFVAEQASWRALLRFAAGLAQSPGKLVEAIAYRAHFLGAPYRPGTWVASAAGDDRVREVTLTDGSRTWTEACDVLCTAYGLVPNLELARLLGCRVLGGVVTANARQESSVPGIFCAGETTGVAGVETSLTEGEIAGLVAAGRDAVPPDLTSRRDVGRAFARSLESAFRPRREVLALAGADTIVCRCEDVPLGAVDPSWTARQAKLQTRLGMGACQGRVCGAAMEYLRGWEGDAVRPPIKPAPVGILAGDS